MVPNLSRAIGAAAMAASFPPPPRPKQPHGLYFSLDGSFKQYNQGVLVAELDPNGNLTIYKCSVRWGGEFRGVSN